MKDLTPDQAARRDWLGLMAKAPAGRVPALLDAALTERPGFDWLRRPETGSVMVRGRTGGTGAPFNLGEMTVTRCALRAAEGAIGHGYVQGRDKADAEAVALVDALMQTAAADLLRKRVLEPLAQAHHAGEDTRAARAAATKVEFFTMVRGED